MASVKAFASVDKLIGSLRMVQENFKSKALAGLPENGQLGFFNVLLGQSQEASLSDCGMLFDDVGRDGCMAYGLDQGVMVVSGKRRVGESGLQGAGNFATDFGFDGKAEGAERRNVEVGEGVSASELADDAFCEKISGSVARQVDGSERRNPWAEMAQGAVPEDQLEHGNVLVGQGQAGVARFGVGEKAGVGFRAVHSSLGFGCGARASCALWKRAARSARAAACLRIKRDNSSKPRSAAASLASSPEWDRAAGSEAGISSATQSSWPVHAAINKALWPSILAWRGSEWGQKLADAFGVAVEGCAYEGGVAAQVAGEGVGYGQELPQAFDAPETRGLYQGRVAVVVAGVGVRMGQQHAQNLCASFSGGKR